ncbi:calcium/sodium antiporter [[Eubacterium] tenue]|nr:calcium/sodium antiporter [[Eubacterium] tenue]MBC8631429.1 calcium/sodium antiporter [[Eubacterium] tenue]MDU1539861.1 calcium/sodium antiporter [Paeniclostridium sordellii]
MIFTIILFLLGFVLITKGADIFIESTISVAKKTNIPEIVLGATIVSLATTFPELTVSAFASIQGHTTMSLGNAIGSIICNTGLALGLVAMIKPFNVDKKIFNSKAILLIISVIVLIILGMDKTIGRMDAMALIGLLVIYMINNYNSIPKTGSRRTSNATNIEYSKSSDMIKLVVMFVIGITMMIIGSRLLVNNGIKIAEVLGVPQAVISLTVIALGTSLPELVSCLTAIRKSHNAISVGNILGANILNIVSVIGLSSFINDIPILKQTSMVDFPFMILLLLILIIPTFIKQKIYRFQGLLMILTYIIYISTLYFTYID